MEEYSYDLRVPKERLAVLIGTKGTVKRELESRTRSSLKVDSKEGIVHIGGNDAIAVYLAREIVRAIARGFSPHTALALLHIDQVFELVDIDDYVKHKGHLERVRGRVIGSDGRTRSYIEEVTETNICVYGKTVGLIGKPEYVSIARKAIESLLQGSPHANVYRWLEKQRKLLKRREHEEDEVDHIRDHVKKDLLEVQEYTRTQQAPPKKKA